jgi:putative copper resistance protein D
VEAFLVTIHLLAATVWVGGTVALVFVGVPVIRTLEGEARARALKALGTRWRPIGYGALGVLVVTGLLLADDDVGNASAGFDAVLAIKMGAVALMIGASLVHDYMLGPRLAAQVRAGEEQTIRPQLVWVGRFAFALTIVVPVLGVALQQLAD